MNIYKKKICATMAIAVILAISFAQMPNAYSAELTVQEKALSTIKDVIGLDIAKYSVELSSFISNRPDDYGGLVREDMVYTLKSDGNKLEFVFRFVNKTLWFVDISAYNRSLLSAHYAKSMPTSVLDATKVILQRLQAYQDASYIQPMRDSMAAVTNINSVNATIGNLKRQVTIYTAAVSESATSTSTLISFMYSVNGADSPKGVNIQFRDGALVAFSNGWKLFNIGNRNVKISREEAIVIAREQANNSTTATLNFGNRPVIADLHLVPREPWTLYPFWFVELPLDYPNSTITGWQVGIWADTGKIEYSHPTGFLGTVPIPTTPPTPPSKQPQSGNSENPPLNMYLISGITAITIAVAAAIVALKKRSK